MTSGLLSKMISKTPTGQVNLYRFKPSSNFVANVTLFKGSSNLATSKTPSHMESNFPFLDKSNLLINAEDNPFLIAASISFLFACKISSLDANKPLLIFCNASDLSSFERVLSTVEAKCEFLAISSAMLLPVLLLMDDGFLNICLQVVRY
ncbi:unnamed protein product [Ambrosiozyma monospora]|uniref:Unnamed protein product n=1 Tax=Ambrosiozyma monospora TaxID=43982 RepID=A0A9W7DJI2_AMBMO|nr:unnamed protein product [Ambrosiozyma monospora]